MSSIMHHSSYIEYTVPYTYLHTQQDAHLAPTKPLLSKWHYRHFSACSCSLVVISSSLAYRYRVYM